MKSNMLELRKGEGQLCDLFLICKHAAGEGAATCGDYPHPAADNYFQVWGGREFVSVLPHVDF